MDAFYRIKSLVIIFIFSVQYGFAQIEDPTNYIRTDLISASPTAENMTRYGDVPVTPYTGMANISIPIFEYQGLSLSLPITLNYNYSGFRPAQETSWVGLGWTLQAGGMITRNIKDKVDGTLVTGRNYEDIHEDILNMAYEDQEFLRDIVDARHSGLLYDGEPDIYTFNFPGHSGKFTIVNGEFHTFPHKRYRFSGNPDIGFTIITDEGIKYVFDVIESTHLRAIPNANYNIPDYNSTFHLSTIIHPNGEKIDFIYEDVGTVLQDGIMTQSFRKINFYNWPFSSGPGTELLSARKTYPTNILNCKELKKIITSKCKIIFNTVYRRDIYGNLGSLKEINIFDHLDQKIKNIRFNLDYFSGGESSAEKYLKLKSIKDADKEYYFEYENESSSFPRSYDAKVDHYGYYNGTGETNIFIPSYYQDIEIGGVYGRNKEPNFTYTKYGALKKIIYPTGGTTEFAYESNYKRRSGDPKYKTESATSKFTSIMTTRKAEDEPVIGSEFKYFVLNHDQPITIDVFRETISGTYNGNLESEVFIYEYDPYENELGELIKASKIKFNMAASRTTTGILSMGNYAYKVIVDSDEQFVEAVISYGYKNPDPGWLGPGIRIKRIKSNPINGNSITKEYEYVDDMGFSTGYSIGITPYQQQIYSYSKYYMSGMSQVYGSSSGFIFNAAIGQAHYPGLEIFYNQVNEYIVSENERLKTTYYFQKFEEAGSLFNFMKADLKQQVNFTYNGFDYDVQKRTINFYKPKHGVGSIFFAVTPYLQSEFYGIDFVESGKEYGFKGYGIWSNWNYLSSTEEILFDKNGKEITKTKTEFEYDLHLKYPRKKEILNSDGTSFAWKFKYPEDYNTSMTSYLIAKNALTLNIETQVLHADKIVSGAITSYNTGLNPVAKFFLETDFALSQLNQETVDAEGKYTELISDSRFNHRINWGYNGNRLISQVKIGSDNNFYEGDISYYDYESFLWGYSNNYVIAHTKFARGNDPFHTSFFHTSFEDIEEGTFKGGKTGEKERRIDFVLDINNIIPGDYTLSYWRKSNGIWYEIKSYLSITDTFFHTTIEASTTSPIDEIRFFPKNALMTTYTYKPMVGISSIMDSNGIVTEYFYDLENRLETIRDEDGNILKHYTYHYKEGQ